MLIRDNIKELKLKYSDRIQDEEDFGNYEDFAKIYTTALVEYYQEIKVKIETFKA